MIVLVVEDAPSVRSRVRALCADVTSVTSVLEADTIEAAKALLVSHRPRVLVLDIHLSGENGLDLLRHSKSEYPEIGVIVLTNDTSGYLRRACAALGADHFFDKSTEFEAIPPVLAAIGAGVAGAVS